MSPEDVNPEWVEKVARAIRADYVARYPEEPPMYHAGPGQPVWRHMARAALAAVLPLAQAAALEPLAEVHAGYFNTEVDAFDAAEDFAPEDAWRFDRDFRDALARLREGSGGEG